MKNLQKFLFLSLFFISGCTVYTEKQSEAVSQNVYATSQSLGKARVDLAYFYSNETTKFIKPPKHPIKIDSIYEQSKTKQRIVVVPDQYKNDKVVVVGSAEYIQLLKDSQIKKQLEKDAQLTAKQIESDNKELGKQKAMSDKMVIDLNKYKELVAKKDLKILWLSIVIVGLIALDALYFYLKANGLFFL